MVSEIQVAVYQDVKSEISYLFLFKSFFSVFVVVVVVNYGILKYLRKSKVKSKTDNKNK